MSIKIPPRVLDDDELKIMVGSPDWIFMEASRSHILLENSAGLECLIQIKNGEFVFTKFATHYDDGEEDEQQK